MDFLHGGHYASWALSVGIPFTVNILKRTLPAKPDSACILGVREFLDSRAPLVPDVLYAFSPALYYGIVATALAGMAFQLGVVLYGSPNELVVASLMVYNFVSCIWPVCGKEFPGLGKTSWIRPQGVVVSVSFIFMIVAVASFLNQDPEFWAAALLLIEAVTTVVDLALYIPPWGAQTTEATLTKRFTLDNDREGFTIDD